MSRMWHLDMLFQVSNTLHDLIHDLVLSNRGMHQGLMVCQLDSERLRATNLLDKHSTEAVTNQDKLANQLRR